MYECPPLETAWPLSQILWWYLSGYLHIWRPLVQVRLTQTPKNVPTLGLLEKIQVWEFAHSLIAHSLILLKSNELLVAQITQIAQDK